MARSWKRRVVLSLLRRPERSTTYHSHVSVCLRPNLPPLSLVKGASHWTHSTRPHLNLITSVKALFPSEVAFRGLGLERDHVLPGEQLNPLPAERNE